MGQRTRLWRQPEVAFLPYIAIRGAHPTTDPTLLWHALAHYAAHPDDRPDLTGPQAATRLPEGD